MHNYLTSRTPFKLNEFEVQPGRDQIIYGGQKHKLEPRVMGVLLFLAQHRERVVSSDELIDKVWQGIVVTPKSVQRCISILRKIFAEDESTTYIQTYSKKGYQLVVLPEPKRLKSHKTFIAFAAIGMVLCSLFGLVYLTQERAQPEKMLSDTGSYSHISLHPKGQLKAWLSHQDSGFDVMVQQGEMAPKSVFKVLQNSGVHLQLNWAAENPDLTVLWMSDDTSHIRVLRFHPESDDAETEFALDDSHYRYRSVGFLNTNSLLVTKTEKSQFNYQLYELEIDTGKSKPITMFPQANIANAQHNLLALKENDGLQQHIHFVNRKTQQIESSHTLLEQINGLLWLPPEQGLLYSTNDKIVQLKQDGSQHLLQEKVEGMINSVGYDNSSNTLYWSESSAKRNLIQKNPDADISVTLADEHSGAYASKPELLAFISNETGLPQIWLSENTQRTQITRFSQKQPISKPIWSTDGSLLAFKAGTTIYSYHLATERLSALLENDYFSEPLGFSKENAMLYFANQNREQSGLWQLHLASKQKEKLAIPSFRQAAVVAGEIYYLGLGNQVLHHFDGKTAKAVADGLDETVEFICSNSHSLYFRQDRLGEARNLYGFNINSKQQELVLNRLDYVGQVSSVADDGRILLSRETHEQRDIYKARKALR